MGGVAILLAWSRSFREIGRLAVASAIGSVAFAASWLAFARLGDLPWRFSLDFTYLNKGAPALSPSVTANIVRYNVGFIGWPILVVCVLAFLVRVRPARRAPVPSDAFLVVAALSAAYYTLSWGSAGKYTVPALALAVVGAVVTFVGRLPVEAWWSELKARPRLAAAWFVALLVIALVAGDAVTAEAGNLVGFSVRAALQDRRLISMVASGASLIILFVLVRRSKQGLLAAAAYACLLAAIPFGLAQHAYVLRNARETLVLSPSDEKGFVNAIDWIDDHVDPSEVVLTYKEVAYHSHLKRVVPIDRAINFTEPQVREWLDDGRVRVAILRDHEAIRFGIPDRFERIAHVGEFSVYERG